MIIIDDSNKILTVKVHAIIHELSRSLVVSSFCCIPITHKEIAAHNGNHYYFNEPHIFFAKAKSNSIFLS